MNLYWVRTRIGMYVPSRVRVGGCEQPSNKYDSYYQSGVVTWIPIFVFPKKTTPPRGMFCIEVHKSSRNLPSARAVPARFSGFLTIDAGNCPLIRRAITSRRLSSNTVTMLLLVLCQYSSSHDFVIHVYFNELYLSVLIFALVLP